MADTVSTITVCNTSRRLVMKFMNLSDGTGESAVVKVDKSTFVGPDGTEPSFFMIEKIQYSVNGMEVLISTDATTDKELARLSGYGEMCWKDSGGYSTKATGDTGDILFTTNGHTAGDSYDITLHLIKKD